MSKCPRCAIGDFDRKPRTDGLKHKPTTAQPSILAMQRWFGSGYARTTDGCKVEMDSSTCAHGHSSWFKLLGVG
jgi:hypothetical protein